MQKSSLVALFVVFLTGVCHSQELNDPFSQSQGVSQGASQGSIDCSDPSMAESPTCSGAQGQRGNTAPSGEFPSSTMRTPTLNTPYGFTPDQYTPTRDRKSTRLNSSHRCISYDVFCLTKIDIEKIESEVLLQCHLTLNLTHILSFL